MGYFCSFSVLQPFTTCISPLHDIHTHHPKPLPSYFMHRFIDFFGLCVVVTIVYGQGKLLYDFPTILWLMLHIFRFISFGRFLLGLVCNVLFPPLRLAHRWCLLTHTHTNETKTQPFVPVVICFLNERKAIYCTFHVCKAENPLSKRISFPINPFQFLVKGNGFFCDELCKRTSSFSLS